MKRSHSCELVVLLLTCAGAAGAAEYEQRQGPATLQLHGGEASADGIRLRLSDELLLTLSVAGAVPERPVGSIAPATDWDVRVQPEQRSGPGESLSWTQRIRLAPRRADVLALQVPPLQLGEQRVTWKPITVRVTTAIQSPDVSSLRDVLPPEALPPRPSWIGWTAVLVAGLGLAGLGAVWVVRRWCQALPVVPVLPEEWLRDELARISTPGLVVERRRCHRRLGRAVRRYLEWRFGVPARRQTTAEVVAHQSLPAELRKLLAELLENCDRAQFAPVEPTEADWHASLSLAHMLLHSRTSCHPVEGPVSPGEGQKLDKLDKVWARFRPK